MLARVRNDRTLSQGWGRGQGCRLDLRQDGFRDALRAYYELATTRIPSNLLRMRDFQDGDMLVTPHLPAEGKVSIHVVNGDYPDCYDYVSDDATHQNHRELQPASFAPSRVVLTQMKMQVNLA